MSEQIQSQNQIQNPLSSPNRNPLNPNSQSPPKTTETNSKTIESNQEEEAPSATNYKI